jgi:hypothetical protein
MVRRVVEELEMAVLEVKAEVVVQMEILETRMAGGLVWELPRLIVLLILLLYYRPGRAEQLEIAPILEAVGREVL